MVNFLEDKISVNSKSILQRFQTVESCIWTLDKIFGGKLFSTRKLISFLLAGALCGSMPFVCVRCQQPFQKERKSIEISVEIINVNPLILIKVYDGWNTNGVVLYDGKTSNVKDNTTIFSITNKMLVHFRQPDVEEYREFYWNVSKIFSAKCKHYHQGTSGTIKSPNYPMLYPHLTDCRWTISVKPGSQVRLLFAFFETQGGVDFMSVYDGTTVHSKLLLAKSGSVPTPFIVDSSTNQVMVRFTSDGDTSFPGFLVVYSSF